jgi:hypothetical protein
MEEALAWPSTYLKEEQSRIVNLWAYWTANSYSIPRNAAEKGYSAQEFKMKKNSGLQIISDGLNLHRIPIR